MHYCMVGLRTSLLLLILPSICSIFFPFILWGMKYFVKDFSTTMQARILTFDDLLYCWIGSHPSPLILPCIFPIFFPSILWRMTLFIKDFSTTMHTRLLIFVMQIDDDLFYHGIENHPSPAYSSCICPFFFPSLLWIMRFFNTDFSATMQARIIIFANLVHSCCTMGLRISLLLLILPCIWFSFSPYFE